MTAKIEPKEQIIKKLLKKYPYKWKVTLQHLDWQANFIKIIGTPQKIISNIKETEHFKQYIQKMIKKINSSIDAESMDLEKIITEQSIVEPHIDGKLNFSYKLPTVELKTNDLGIKLPDENDENLVELINILKMSPQSFSAAFNNYLTKNIKKEHYENYFYNAYDKNKLKAKIENLNNRLHKKPKIYID